MEINNIEVDIDLGSDGEVVEPKNDKIALIDADTLAFTACLSAIIEEDILPREFYSDKEWEEIEKSPYYNEELMVIKTIDLESAMIKAEEKLQKIYDKTGCRDCEMYFTSGRKNFRYVVNSEYKANRKDIVAPPGLSELKKRLNNKYSGNIATEWEADDEVVYLKKKYPDKYILVALDKDVYNSIEGKHFNYYESSLYNINMKWVEVSAEQAKMWPYLQTIIGDKTDNIQGCKGIGPKKAMKFIGESMSTDELWQGVVTAWESKGMTSIDALVVMNLVNMHLLQEIEGELKIVLWSPYV